MVRLILRLDDVHRHEHAADALAAASAASPERLQRQGARVPTC